MNKSASEQYFAVVPAAGVGRRMGNASSDSLPKQYLPIAGKTILEHTLSTLIQGQKLQRVIVAVAEADSHWQSLSIFDQPIIHTVTGGDERHQSVLNGLQALENVAADDDWVLVHDVARPCVSWQDINHLIDTVNTHTVGGILAVPMSDTVKQVFEKNHIKKTVDREGLWRALTPQMFRYGLLKRALESALAKRQSITDEASAIELAGLTPIIVEGASSNIKVTRPEDLALAEYYLKQGVTS